MSLPNEVIQCAVRVLQNQDAMPEDAVILARHIASIEPELFYGLLELETWEPMQ